MGTSGGIQDGRVFRLHFTYVAAQLIVLYTSAIYKELYAESMVQQPSPYTPGTSTSIVTGRERQLEEIDERIAYVSTFRRLSGRIHVDVGPRGIGKTSLLRAAQRGAVDHGFVTVWVTAGDSPLLAALAVEVDAVARTWKDSARAALARATDGLTLNFGVATVKPSRKSSGERPLAGGAREFQGLIRIAAQAAVKEGHSGLAVFIDELQAADADGLRSLGYAWQHMQAEDAELPALCVTAGLSHTQDVLTDAVSFAERFQYTHLANLDREAADRAVTAPAEAVQVAWTAEALDLAWRVSQGYPYFVQLIADEMWRAAGYPSVGSVIDSSRFEVAEIGFARALESFYRARWLKATEREAELLSVMAAIGGAAIRRGDIAERMGVSTQALSMARRSLMDKGLIESSGHGSLRFTAPGFADFIRTYVIGVDD